MTASIIDQNSFVCGAVQEADLAYLAVVIDEFAGKRMPHGLLMQWQAGLFQRIAPVKWNIVSLAVMRHPMPCVVALGETGLVVVAGSGWLKQEDVGAATATGSVVPLRSVTAVGSNAYAVGMRRQAYQRSLDGTWRAIHGDMLAPSNSDTVTGFEAVMGVSESEIYAAGWEGEIWRFDGARWFRVPSPTNLIITSLASAQDGQVYACGQAGLLLVGRGDNWDAMDSGTKDDLWSITSFKNRIFVAGFRDLFELKDGKLNAVDEACALTNSFYSLSNNGEILLSVGPKSVLVFDGTTWRRVV